MTRLLRAVVAFLIASFVWSATASAETVEVVPGVRLTKRSYDLPINEQPFYGFAKKNHIMLDADKKFIESELKAVGTPEKAYERSLGYGWQAFNAGHLVIAARRFNQASLFTREPSALYHSFAVIAQTHLNDPGYAEELFKIAATRPNPWKSLNADYGRFLMMTRRPAEALPVLEQAVRDTPDMGYAWSNLDFARLFAGNRDGACAAAAEAAKLPSTRASDLSMLKTAAKCDDRT